MFMKQVFKLEMFVAVCWSYGNWCISIVRCPVSLSLSLLFLLTLFWGTPRRVVANMPDCDIKGRDIPIQSVSQLWQGSSDITLLWYLICIRFLLFHINPCINLLNMFMKQVFKLEMFVVVCWSYGKLCISIFTNPSARGRYGTRSIFKRSLTGLISEFSFS